jgi:chromosome segregation ATPase
MSTIKVEDEPEEDPVRVNLENEVRQRDASISALEKARLEKQQELVALEKELEGERLQQMKEPLTHKIESERIKRQTAHAEERLKALETDMQDKAAIHEYANLIKGVAPKGGVDSQYVLKLQTQLQKAVKKMEATTEQMKDLEENNRQVVDGLTKEISQLVEDRCRTELELRKQMEVLQESKRDMQLQYEARIRENLKTLQALRAKAASQTSIDELDEELVEAESRLEELRRIHETQEQTIETLNKSLAQAGGM